MLWPEGIYISEMSVKQADGMSIAQALAMTVAEIPVFLYSTFGQVNLLCMYSSVLHLYTQALFAILCRPVNKI